VTAELLVYACAALDWREPYDFYRSVRPLRLLQNCENDILLKTNELILMQIGRSGPQGKSTKRSTVRLTKGQLLKSHMAEDLAEASVFLSVLLFLWRIKVLTVDPFGRVAFF